MGFWVEFADYSCKESPFIEAEDRIGETNPGSRFLVGFSDALASYVVERRVILTAFRT
jgi:hypothetical protein